ncbi:Protein-methionine-sulfoxide reductase catalytic subunit MsrP [Meiothermus luteus]|uniref:Protein-methionine-sulfoxide reductase catalytic subunit MsrP n=1 Tax=Meiothermus luteus TaxID=2026184 RepID=A0A399EZK6_9DEIN|nr:sulfite oxidase-like oxidoreductase [Meiothermus luteus]RIH89015.1 Protein-methionine-sulfoxide reductase catalytic subunit MsrP [Meiothermus luteus]RMH53690.1 MAG: sulfite oxidase-like oxidoreductase [Deinococcota bacterium]
MFGSFYKPKHPAHRVPPGQVLTDKFPVLTYGPTPSLRPEEVRLEVGGQVENPLSLGWDELMALPQTGLKADFHCVTRWSRLDVEWQGVRVLELLQQARPRPEARYVLVYCYGGYTTSLPLEDFAREENLLAHTLFGQPLPREHGGPLRLVVPHLYAWKSAKWVRGFQLLEREELGFWERNGYHRRGDPWREERFSSPGENL